jgi:hypothetical protein
MSQSSIPPISRTDTEYQEVKLFIEGVQVPFTSITVTSTLGELPTATVAVPPQVGLMEITRFYNPKVHIFFTDPIDGEEKVLFSGVVTSPQFSKAQDGSNISFNCVHRYVFMSQILVDYSGWAKELVDSNASNEQAVKSPAPNSLYGVGLAMTGILRDKTLHGDKKEINEENVQDDVKTGKDTTSPAILPDKFSDYDARLIGMPGVLLNFWLQLKKFALKQSHFNEIMLKMYVPLLEDGLQFFNRVTGHFFLEDKIEEDRVDPCLDKPSSDASNKPRLVPPSLRTFLRSSVQTDMGVQMTYTQLEFSGELADIMSIFRKFMESMDYEMLYLSSPAEVMLDPTVDDKGSFVAPEEGTHAVDVVVKPQLPFYFSPLCNVLYPNMIRSVNVSQDDWNIPTRITLRNQEVVRENQNVDTYYRAPASIREAIAGAAGLDKKQVVDDTKPSTDPKTTKPGTREEVVNPTKNETTTVEVPHMKLSDTFGPSRSKVGKYEQGRGLKAEKMLMPKWLSYYSASQFKDDKGADGWPDPSIDPESYAAVKQLYTAWTDRYGVENNGLNPWNKDSGIKSYQRLLVASADYQYAMSIARSRSGTASTIFNPYIVPGYPMDILDSTPNHPSFHAYCLSVTHTITSNSIETSVAFGSAMTYTEIANYYMPAVHPWLQNVLGLAKTQSLTNLSTGDVIDVPLQGEAGETTVTIPSSKLIADKFYLGTLGVGSAAPTELYDYNTGIVYPVIRKGYGLLTGTSEDSSFGPNKGELNPMLSGTGNLSLVQRPIESRDNVEERWDIKFIDITPGNYNTQVIAINNEKLAQRDALEPGQSQWLDYTPMFEDPTQDADTQSDASTLETGDNPPPEESL